MKHLSALLVGWLITAAPALASGQTPKSPSEIAKEQSQAVVVIEQLDGTGQVLGQGSGFIVTPGGAIVTNLHVVQGGASLRVKLPNGDVYKTSDLVDVDEGKDIAIIKIKGFQLPVVQLGDSDRTEVGEAIVAISSPEGLTNSLSTGVISGVRRFETHRVFQITAPISHGSSGGALFDSRGNVIGIITFVFKAGQNINFALPINYVRGMISDQVMTTLAKLSVPAKAEASGPASLGEAEAPLDSRLSTTARTRPGQSPQDPMFVRPDEALAFFFRLVEGIGHYGVREVADLTRVAPPVKTRETAAEEAYTIRYLSFYSGVTLGFSKPDRILSSVELLVNWSVEDLERAFGDKYKKKTGADGKKYLEFKKQDDGRQVIAALDAHGLVRSVRFSKTK